jgi:hypothetical protein
MTQRSAARCIVLQSNGSLALPEGLRLSWKWDPIGHRDGKYCWYAYIEGRRYQLVEPEPQS